jgi:hypothetical protein
MSVRSRVNRLEQVAAARGMRDLPILTLTELLDEPGVFTEDSQCYPQRHDVRTEPSQRYTEADFPELEKQYRLILVCWDTVRAHAGGECIQL